MTWHLGDLTPKVQGAKASTGKGPVTYVFVDNDPAVKKRHCKLVLTIETDFLSRVNEIYY